jgi:hypothetical protein
MVSRHSWGKSNEIIFITYHKFKKLRVFENRTLRRILGLKRDEVTGGWRKLHNWEIHNNSKGCTHRLNIVTFHHSIAIR